MSKSIFSRVTKLRASLTKRYHLAFRSGYSVETAYNCNFLIDWNHPVDKKLAFQSFEHERLTKFTNNVKRMNPSLFLDIGAHAGLYSILINSKVPGAMIHAFEPDIVNLGQLHANLFLNQISERVHVHPFGLSDKEGTVSFESAQNQDHRAFSKISESGDSTVTIKRLDSTITGKDQKIAMKIDVEGHEISVLRGAEGVLNQNLCYLQIESSDENFPIVKSHLEGLGYHWLATAGDHYFTNITDFKH